MRSKRCPESVKDDLCEEAGAKKALLQDALRAIGHDDVALAWLAGVLLPRDLVHEGELDSLHLLREVLSELTSWLSAVRARQRSTGQGAFGTVAWQVIRELLAVYGPLALVSGHLNAVGFHGGSTGLSPKFIEFGERQQGTFDVARLLRATTEDHALQLENLRLQRRDLDEKFGDERAKR